MDKTNPKDLMGIKKTRISLLPAEGIRYGADAMEYGALRAPRADGGLGYGPYNWRDKEVKYSIYLEATIRHALALLDREDLDPTSKVHHIGHIIANGAILADAIKHNCLIDDRPPLPTKGNPNAKL